MKYKYHLLITGDLRKPVILEILYDITLDQAWDYANGEVFQKLLADLSFEHYDVLSFDSGEDLKRWLAEEYEEPNF